MEKFNSYKYEQRAGEGNVRQLDVTSTRPVICGSYDTTGGEDHVMESYLRCWNWPTR